MLKTDFADQNHCQKKWTWLKSPNPICQNTDWKPWSRFQKPDFAEKRCLREKPTLTDENFCLPELWLKTLKPIFRTWQSQRRNYARKRQTPIFEKRQTWKRATAKNADFCELKTLQKTRNLILKIQTPIWKTSQFWKPRKRFNARGCPTVCVTRAGAGGGTPSDWENAEA